MLTIEDKHIYITRGDMMALNISAIDIINNDSLYNFQVGDVLRFKIMESDNVKNILLQKDFKVEEEGTTCQVMLTSHEMKIGDLESEAVTYWYEVEVNPDTDKTQTIIGYDAENGPSELTILPEGGDETDD